MRFGSRSFPGWTTADYFTFPLLFHLIFFQHAHSKQRVGQKTLQYAQALLIHIQEFYSTSQSAISSQLVSATILLVSSAPVLCRILYQCLPQSSTATLYIYHPSGDVMWSLFVLDLIVFCTLSIAAFPYHLLAFSGRFWISCASVSGHQWLRRSLVSINRIPHRTYAFIYPPISCSRVSLHTTTTRDV